MREAVAGIGMTQVLKRSSKATHSERWYPKSNKTIDGRGRDIDIEGHQQEPRVAKAISEAER